MKTRKDNIVKNQRKLKENEKENERENSNRKPKESLSSRLFRIGIGCSFQSRLREKNKDSRGFFLIYIEKSIFKCYFENIFHS